MANKRVIHLSKMTGAAGSEGHLLTLLPGLRARKVDARLWVLVEPGYPVQDIIDRAQGLDIPTERVDIRRHLDPVLWRRLVQQFRAAQPDIVHTHLIHADLYGISAARRAHVPYIVSTRHNDDKFRYWLPLRLLNRWLWAKTDQGIAISEAIRQFSIRIEHAAAERIHTVHYGLDPGQLTAPPDARAQLRAQLGVGNDTLLVGSVCRLIEQKGLIYGIRGFSQIAERVPNAHYVLAGDGEMRSTLHAEVRGLGLSERVHFLGWRRDSEVVFAALDVLLAPSLWEGFGLVFLESMAFGIPVISTHTSAIPEVVVDGATGWLVPPRDADALGSVLFEALTQPEVRHARGAAGRQRLETQFTVETMVTRTLAVYDRLEAPS